jgi:hypothetical protein
MRSRPKSVSSCVATSTQGDHENSWTKCAPPGCRRAGEALCDSGALPRVRNPGIRDDRDFQSAAEEPGTARAGNAAALIIAKSKRTRRRSDHIRVGQVSPRSRGWTIA